MKEQPGTQRSTRHTPRTLQRTTAVSIRPIYHYTMSPRQVGKGRPCKSVDAQSKTIIFFNGSSVDHGYSAPLYRYRNWQWIYGAVYIYPVIDWLIDWLWVHALNLKQIEASNTSLRRDDLSASHSSCISMGLRVLWLTRTQSHSHYRPTRQAYQMMTKAYRIKLIMSSLHSVNLRRRRVLYWV